MSRKKAYLSRGIAALVLLACMAFTGPGPKRGDAVDVPVTSVEELGPFDKVNVSSGLKVIVTPKVDRMEVRVSRRMREHLQLKVRAGVLYASFQRITEKLNVIENPGVTIYLPQKEYRSFAVNASSVLQLPEDYSAGNVEIAVASSGRIEGGMNCNRLRIEASSSAVVDLEGKCNILMVYAASSSSVRCAELEAGQVTCSASSSASVSVRSVQKLQVTASSSSRVVYYGDPKEVTEKLNSSATLKKK